MLLFFAMPWVSLQSVIVVFPGHTHSKSKTCVKGHFKLDKPQIFMTNGSLVKVESIADCSP